MMTTRSTFGSRRSLLDVAAEPAPTLGARASGSPADSPAGDTAAGTATGRRGSREVLA